MCHNAFSVPLNNIQSENNNNEFQGPLSLNYNRLYIFTASLIERKHT